MKTHRHALRGSPLGSRRDIVSFHYGPQDRGRKAYLQASLHADELPGMLVAHHLRPRLLALEAEGRLRGEVVLVPVANPIGLAQSVLRSPQGRFDLHSGENFNRHYPAPLDAVLAAVEGRLGDDAAGNVAVIRAALREAVRSLPDDTELASQRKIVFGLACESDIVLDLHCDSESLAHLYTGTPLWPQVEALARLIGAQASLLALQSGDNPFDEACAQIWWQLRERLPHHPIPLACIGVTVELRGTADVSHAQAMADADALIAYLAHAGLVDAPPVVLPPLLQPATPLDATEVLAAPVSGVVVYVRELGDHVHAGETVLELIDPIDGAVHAVQSRSSGLLLARDTIRYASAGRKLCKIVGTVPVRSGKLSSD